MHDIVFDVINNAAGVLTVASCLWAARRKLKWVKVLTRKKGDNDE